MSGRDGNPEDTRPRDRPPEREEHRGFHSAREGTAAAEPPERSERQSRGSASRDRPPQSAPSRDGRDRPSDGAVDHRPDTHRDRRDRPPDGEPRRDRPPLDSPLEPVPGPRRRGARGGRRPPSRLRRRQSTDRPDPEVDGDPVKHAFAGRVDLYEVATWEPRTWLDSVAVSLTGALRAARRVALVGVALLLLLAQVVIAGAIVVEEPLVGSLAVLSILPALGVAGYLWYGDPTRREPLLTLAATFLLSILFAGFAGVVNTALGPLFDLSGVAGLIAFYFLVVGPVEEVVKWLAIRVYAYRSGAFGAVVDGVVYGAAAGVGFAAIENLLYIATTYVQAAEATGIAPRSAATSVAAQRLVVGPGHVVFSAWAGFYLGLAKFNPENRGPIVVKGLLIAAFIHALYNSAVTVLPSVLPTLGLFGFIVAYHGFWFALLYRKVRAYRSLYRQRTPSGVGGLRR